MFFLGMKAGVGSLAPSSSHWVFPLPPCLDSQKKIPRRAMNPAGFLFLWVAGARFFFQEA